MRISYKLTAQIKAEAPIQKIIAFPNLHTKRVMRHNHVPNQRAGFAFQKTQSSYYQPKVHIISTLTFNNALGK